MYSKTFVVGAAATIALATAGIAAAGGASDGQRGGDGRVSARTASTLTSCDGGPQVRVLNRIRSAPFTFDESSPNYLVPGAAAVVKGPKKGTDTLSITFSAETQLGGSTDTENLTDWMGLEVLVDGVPIQPFTAVGDVLAITGSNSYNSNAAQFCTRVGKGKHRVEVRTNLFDGGGNSSLTGWLDDYTLRVEQSK